MIFIALRWREGSIHSELEKRPVCGGSDSDGTEIYVGRALYNGLYLPCKIMPSKNEAYVGEFPNKNHKNVTAKELTSNPFLLQGYGGVEYPVENFEYLSGRARYFSWVPASDGEIVDGAVWTGDENGERLYVGRASHEGSLTIGKIHPSHGNILTDLKGLKKWRGLTIKKM